MATPRKSEKDFNHFRETCVFTPTAREEEVLSRTVHPEEFRETVSEIKKIRFKQLVKRQDPTAQMAAWKIITHKREQKRIEVLVDQLYIESGFLVLKNLGIPRLLGDGDVLEVPDEEDPLFHQHIHELIAGYGIHILPGLGYRGAEENPFLPQVIHGPHHLLKMSFPPTLVGLLFEALHADHGGHVTQSGQSLGHLLVDEGSIGINLEDDISMFFVEIEQIRPDEGLPA